jgi:threonine dehydratase
MTMDSSHDLELTEPLSAAEISGARRRIKDAAVRTPLVRARDGDLHLKLECLQPTGSYKIRGATNALKARIEGGGELRAIVSASAGNFGQAIVAAAAALGIPAVIHVPDNAARVKVDNLRRLGATVREHSFADWWRIMETRQTDDDGIFFHPVCERAVIAGAATIGAEIVEDLPGVGAIFIPIGGGGLASGIAQAVKRARPECRIIAVETDTATPLKAALEAERPVTVERQASFVDGMGSTRVLDAMWPLLRRLIDDVVVVSLSEVEEAMRGLAADHHVIAEGAGAAAVAAAAKAGIGKAGIGKAVAIVSGGNLDWAEMRRIFPGAAT